jgi:hypothetical protein
VVVQKKAKIVKRSEDYLSDLDEIKIKLDNGKTVSLKWKEEVWIPDDPVGVVREARRAPSRYAFWAYQTERALQRVRKLETDEAAIAGEKNYAYRLMFNQQDGLSDAAFGLQPTEGLIKSHVDNDQDVKAARVKLNGARRDHGVLRAVAEAQRQRCFVLNQLVAQQAKENLEA